MGKLPEEYIGREQAYIKHKILEAYLKRLFMIVGQKKADVINFVDCFSGPWQEGDELLSDTSIGISLKQMKDCQEKLYSSFGRKVKFRALFIEKEEKAYTKLKAFLTSDHYPTIETECIHGEYAKNSEEIVNWCEVGFTFFFIDPKGWQGTAELRPFLEMKNSEFLINLMYDFINRFVTDPEQKEKMVDIFGEIPDFTEETSLERQSILLSLFRKNLNRIYGGKSAFVRIEKPGSSRTLYYLVYLTQDATGLDVFKTEAEKIDIIQRRTQKEVKFRTKLESSSQSDIFGINSDLPLDDCDLANNIDTAKEYLLMQLRNGPVLIDREVWADFLEETDLFPSDFHSAMRDLIAEKIVVNLDANASRRKTKVIKPSWPEKVRSG